MPWRCLAPCTAWALVALASVPPDRVADTTDRAVVFLRVIGSIELTQDQNLRRRPDLQLSDVELATGSGFFFSPLGYVLTNYHVVRDVETTLNLDGVKIKGRLKVGRIEVLLPGDTTPGAPDAASARYEASIVASSQEFDLAVLSVSGAALPFLQFGDSDAIEAGDPVEVLGFPFGRDVEIGRPGLRTDKVPSVSLSSGNVGAFRTDEQGQRRYVQTTASLNPGNSGGPMVDGDGYVVGIASRVITGGKTAGVGFAVPINLVKAFLESSGLDALLPVRRLFLGPQQVLEGKGLRMRLPQGLTDISRRRALVETAGSIADAPLLRIDRIVSPWSPSRLADVLTGGQAFEPMQSSTLATQRVRTVGGRQIVLGHVTGTLGDDEPLVRMAYAVLDLGSEKIVARYLGAPDQLAFNASVLRASLGSIEAEPLRVETRDFALPAAWTPAAWSSSTSRFPRLVLPAGWPLEPAGPSTCPGLPALSDVVSASYPADFAIALRAGLVRGTPLTPEQAGAACGGQARVEDAASYQRRVEWLGTVFVFEGRFVPAGPNELLQLEGVAPAQKARGLPALVAQWAEQVRR